MTDASSLLNQLLAAGAVTQPAFGPESRYSALPLATHTSSRGEELRYVTRRFIPPPERFALLQTYRIRQGDRIDNLGASLAGDPLFYWRICDANLALDPDDVTAVVGATIRITLPAGIPGTPGGA
jgi:hypothetical protein